MQGSKKMYIYIVISFILASAFCLSSFATESLSLDDSQFSLIWNAQNWNYFTQRYPTSSGTASVGFPGDYKQYYMFDSESSASYNGLTVFGRQFYFGYLNTAEIVVNIPLSLQNIDNFNSDFFIGLWGPGDTEVVDLRDYITEIEFRYSSTSGTDFPTIISFNNNYLFSSSPEPTIHGISFVPLRRYNILINEDNVSRLIIRAKLNSPLPSSCYFFCGMASDTEIGAQDGQQQAIIGGLSGIQGTIDGLVSDLQENDGKILDSLGNVEYILEGDAVTAQEAEKMVEDSVSKSEELDQLGDALANVEKPDINNVTQQFSPNIILGQSDNATLQLALSQVYSWDKLITILGVFVAVFSISFIVFGKKK